MSEETQNEEATALESIEPLVVERNNVQLEHKAAQVERGKKNKGNIYFLPEINPKDPDKVKWFLLDYLGLNTVYKMVWAKYRQICQASASSAMEAEEEEAGYRALLARYLGELSFRGESKPELEKQLDELLQVDMLELVAKQSELAAKGDTEGLKAMRGDYEELLTDIARVKAAINAASRTPKKKAEDKGEEKTAE